MLKVISLYVVHVVHLVDYTRNDLVCIEAGALFSSIPVLFLQNDIIPEI